MTYATQTDLVDRFGVAEIAQLTDPVNGSTINATTVARALADADAEVDARLAPRYALPLASTPAVLVRVAADMARYFLWDVRANEQVRNRYKDAITLLDKFATGAVKLDSALALAAAPGASELTVRAPTRQFGTTMLDAFAPPG